MQAALTLAPGNARSGKTVIPRWTHNGEAHPWRLRAKPSTCADYMRRRHAEAQAGCTTERGTKLAAVLIELEQARETLRQAQLMPPLSASAQQRVEAAIRQHKQNLDAEFSQQVEEEVTRRMREFVLPHFLALYEEAVKTRKGIMDRAAYRLIWSCLHDDSRKSVSSEKLNKAFNIWTEAKAKVLGEEKNSTPKFMVDIRRTAAEWQASFQAAAKRRWKN